MSHITISEDIAAPVEDVFNYVDEHTNTTRYMKDLTKWKPVGPNSHGKGAKFAVAMKAGPMTLSSIVDITTWMQNSAIGWTSIEGFKQKGKWTFTPRGDGTVATFDMEYELPGGIAGRMVSRVAEPIVRGNIEQSVRNLRTQVEKRARKPATGSTTKTTAKATAKKTGAASRPVSRKR
jgi:uncharacterized membrane protein